MADQKLSALTELAATPAVDDEVYIRDVSEAAADESKRITTANLLASKADAANETKYVLKAVTETVNNSDVFQDDDALKFTALANKFYHVRVWLLLITTDAADIKFKWDVPVAADIDWINSGMIGASFSGKAMTYSAAASELTISGTGTYQILTFEGLLYTGANAGAVTLQWAQYTAEVSDTEVHARSFLSYRLMN